MTLAVNLFMVVSNAARNVISGFVGIADTLYKLFQKAFHPSVLCVVENSAFQNKNKQTDEAKISGFTAHKQSKTTLPRNYMLQRDKPVVGSNFRTTLSPFNSVR